MYFFSHVVSSPSLKDEFTKLTNKLENELQGKSGVNCSGEEEDASKEFKDV